MDLQFEWNNQKAKINFQKHGINFEEVKTMKNKNNSATNQNLEENSDLLPEYNFDYSKARSNRFATQINSSNITVTLESDVAKVFKTSEDVNQALRAILTAIPRKKT